MPPEQDERCLFCGIVAGTIPSTIVASTSAAVAFRDINPGAPVHVLVVPRQHIPGIDASAAEDGALLAELVRLANEVARHEGVAESGYRLVWNVGQDAGQSVGHLHLHLLGGRRMAWPPG